MAAGQEHTFRLRPDELNSYRGDEARCHREITEVANGIELTRLGIPDTTEVWLKISIAGGKDKSCRKSKRRLLMDYLNG